jgi:hypothetical protein
MSHTISEQLRLIETVFPDRRPQAEVLGSQRGAFQLSRAPVRSRARSACEVEADELPARQLHNGDRVHLEINRVCRDVAQVHAQDRRQQGVAER